MSLKSVSDHLLSVLDIIGSAHTAENSDDCLILRFDCENLQQASDIVAKIAEALNEVEDPNVYATRVVVNKEDKPVLVVKIIEQPEPKR